MAISRTQLACSYAEDAKRKMYFLSAVCGCDSVVTEDPENFRAIADFIYDATKDIEAVLDNLKKKGVTCV